MVCIYAICNIYVYISQLYISYEGAVLQLLSSFSCYFLDKNKQTEAREAKYPD